MTNILITGANGFIGSALVSKLAEREAGIIRVAVRKSARIVPKPVEIFENLELSENTDWTSALNNIDVVIHCAARAHLLKDKASDSLTEFRKVNTAGTLHLAQQAARSGVKRFIFISSIGVNGAETFTKPFMADDTPQPHSPYAQSKFEAECGLSDLSQTTKMSVVIIRPSLVYGPNAPGNFGILMRIVKKPIPIPLGRVTNKRSFVFLDNLVDLISLCVTHPNAANQIFLVSDDEDLSTTQLLRRMRNVFSRPIMLLPVPVYFLSAAAKLVRKDEVARSLLGSLQVDIQKTKSLLGWTPPFSVDDGLRKIAGSPQALYYPSMAKRLL